jgi:hypothetical protein
VPCKVPFCELEEDHFKRFALSQEFLLKCVRTTFRL